MLLEDILESIGRISSYTTGFDRETFLADRKTIDAVVRNLEIVGEACARISEDAKSIGPEIEWGQIVSLRNRIVHDYFGVDTEIVWEIVRHDLPTLDARLRLLLERLPRH